MVIVGCVWRCFNMWISGSNAIVACAGRSQWWDRFRVRTEELHKIVVTPIEFSPW